MSDWDADWDAAPPSRMPPEASYAAPPSRMPPSKPPPLPPKPSHISSQGMPPSLPLPSRPPPSVVSRRQHSDPPDYCNLCGVLYSFGSAATSEKKIGEPSVVEGMGSVAAFQVASGDSHGAILAGGKRAGLYLWEGSGVSESVVSPKLETVNFADMRLQSVACGGPLTAVVSEEGHVFLWAQKGSAALESIPRTPTRFQAPALSSVACGEGHVLALSAKGSMLLAWGANDFGQLGLGADAGTFYATLNVVMSVKGLSEVAAGSRHSAVVTTDGQLYTWGSNALGQCGLASSGKAVDCLPAPHLHAQPFPSSSGTMKKKKLEKKLLALLVQKYKY